MSLPVLVSVIFLALIRFMADDYFNESGMLIAFGIAYALFIVASCWWVYSFFTKLRFVRNAKT